METVDDEVVFKLPKANADEFGDDEITFNVSPRKRVHKRALTDVSNSPAVSRKGTKPATRSFFWDKCTGSPPRFWKTSKNIDLAPEQRAALAASFAKSEPVAPKRLRCLTASSGTKHGGAAAVGRSKATPSPSVLSIERRRQIGIILARLKTTAEELCVALERLAPEDVEALKGERLGMILELAPTGDEVRALQAFAERNDAAALDSADKTLAALMGVPKCMLRLRALECFHTFDTASNELSQVAEALCVGCDEVIHSDTLKSTLKTILAAGNCLNEGSTHGGASGFKLQSLAKLGHMKTLDGTRTMLDVVLDLMRADTDSDKNLADILQTELAGLQIASKCSFSAMCVDHASHSRRLETMQDEICASSDSSFADAFTTFVERARKSLAEHSAIVRRTGAKLQQMLCHFGEGESTKGDGMSSAEDFAIMPSAQTTALSDGVTAFFCTLGAFLDEIAAAEAKHQRRTQSERERTARLQRVQKQGGSTGASPNDSNDAPSAVAEMMRMANEKRMRFDAMRCSSDPVDSPRTMRVKQLKMKQKQTVTTISQEAETGMTAQGTFTDSASEMPAMPAVTNDSIEADHRPESASQADLIEKMSQQLAALRTELKAAQAQATSVKEVGPQRAELEHQVAALRTELEAAQLQVLASIESATTQRAEFELQMTALRTELEAAQVHVTNSAKLDDTHKQLEAQAERIAKLEKVKMTNGHIKYVAKLKKERGALEKDVKALRKELIEFKMASAVVSDPAPAPELKGKCEKLETEIKKMHDEVAELQHELTAARADTSAAAKLEEIARTRCSKLEAKLQAVRSKGNAVERSFTEAESSFSSAIDEKSSQIEKQCAQIAELETSLSMAHDQCKEMNVRVTELTKQVRQGTDEMTKTQDKYHEAIRSKSTAEERIGHLQAETKVLQAELQQAQCALANAKETEVILREKISAVGNQCDKASTARDKFQVEFAEAKELLSARSEEAEERIRCIEKLQGEVSDVKARYATASAQLETAQQQSSNKASELEQLQADYELHASTQVARIAALESEVESLRSQLNSAEKSASEAREQLSLSAEDTAEALATTKANLENFRQKAESAQKSADVNMATCEKLRLELQRARADDTAHQAELEDCRTKSREELDALGAQLKEKVLALESTHADLAATMIRADQSEAEVRDIKKARDLVDEELVSVRSELEHMQHHARSIEIELEELRKAPTCAAIEPTDAVCETATEAAAEKEAEQQLRDADDSYDPNEEDLPSELSPGSSRRSRRTARLSIDATDCLEALIDDETEPEEEDKRSKRARRSARLSIRLSSASDVVNDEPVPEDKPEPTEEDKTLQPTPAKGKKKRRKLRGKKSLCPGAFADVKQMLDSEEVEVVFLGKGKGYLCSGCGAKLPSKSAAEMHKKSCDSI